MTPAHTELERLANKIAGGYKQKFECRVKPDGYDGLSTEVGIVDEDGMFKDFIKIEVSEYTVNYDDDREFGEFVAAANPAAILSMLADIRRLEDEVAKFKLNDIKKQNQAARMSQDPR